MHISFVLLLLLWIVLQGPHLLLPSVSIILSKSSPQETVILKVVSSSTKNIILIIVITYCYIILYRHNKFIILIAIVNMYSIRYSKRKFTLMTIIFILWLWKRFIIIVFIKMHQLPNKQIQKTILIFQFQTRNKNVQINSVFGSQNDVSSGNTSYPGSWYILMQ